MNKVFMSIVALTLFFLFSEENAFAASGNPSEVSVSLKNYVGKAKEVTVTVDGEYMLSGESGYLLKKAVRIK